jgi:uncharacterized protein (TIGR03437 family)
MRNKVCLSVGLVTLLCASSVEAATGSLRYFQLAASNWDPFTSSRDPATRAFISQHLSRIGTFSPFFDNKLSWMPEALVYFDAYAIYLGSSVAALHPEWILKDALGNNLFIPYQCALGLCPQYAGDISNPDFRAFQIAQMRQIIAVAGRIGQQYKGVWLDDVNLDFSVSDGSGAFVAPVDTATGLPMTAADWERYFVEYVELIRASLPSYEILHNSVWFAAGGTNDPYVRRQILAADYINLERGFGDSGIIGGTGKLSFSSLLRYIDFVHSLGVAIVVEDYLLANQSYSLAAYFLTQADSDGFGILEQTPANWPAHLYDVQLGPPVSGRYVWNGMRRRDFANGIVLVNEPGSPVRNVTLPAGLTDADGNALATLTLRARQGGVYLYTVPTPAVMTLDGIQAQAYDLNGKLVGPGNPASIGDYISVYCMNLGPVDPPVPPGTPASASPLSYTVNQVSVVLGGVDAPVIFAGLAPGAVGIYQINLQIPQGASLGDVVPIFIGSGGLTSVPAAISLH